MKNDKTDSVNEKDGRNEKIAENRSVRCGVYRNVEVVTGKMLKI